MNFLAQVQRSHQDSHMKTMTQSVVWTVLSLLTFVFCVTSAGRASGEAAGRSQTAIPAPSDVTVPPADAETTSSGLATKVITPGTGAAYPRPSDSVTVHYTGWTTDGQMFDSSVVRGQPSTFPLNRVIKGWTEGVQLMVVGEKRRLWIPEALAYGGRPGTPQGMLVFDIELLAIQ